MNCRGKVSLRECNSRKFSRQPLFRQCTPCRLYVPSHVHRACNLMLCAEPKISLLTWTFFSILQFSFWEESASQGCTLLLSELASFSGYGSPSRVCCNADISGLQVDSLLILLSRNYQASCLYSRTFDFVLPLVFCVLWLCLQEALFAFFFALLEFFASYFCSVWIPSGF